jgi:homoserine kinase type II
MSVYTSISDKEFSEILNTYPLGQFIRAQGISTGIENTNYFVTTTNGEYVFTLFEKIKPQELKFYISLLDAITASNIACPQPQANKHKKIIGTIKNKPFIFVTRIKGEIVSLVNLDHCKAISIALAKLHSTPLLTPSSVIKPPKNRFGKRWRDHAAKNIMPKLSKNDAKLLSSELVLYERFNYATLPHGIIHSDLFKDNVLFEHNQISGIIDFYDACYDSYLYDVAVTVNDWCTNKEGTLNEIYLASFLINYQTIRPLTDREKSAWPLMLRIAALRFWLSRLEDSLNPREGVLTHSKNPNTYKQILQNHILKNHPPHPLENCG